jgi:hypothetical protein
MQADAQHHCDTWTFGCPVRQLVGQFCRLLRVGHLNRSA